MKKKKITFVFPILFFSPLFLTLFLISIFPSISLADSDETSFFLEDVTTNISGKNISNDTLSSNTKTTSKVSDIALPDMNLYQSDNNDQNRLNYYRDAKEKLKKNIHINIDLPSINIWNGLFLDFGAGYSVTRYQNHGSRHISDTANPYVYLRGDHLKLGIGLFPGDFLGTLPVSIRINQQAEIFYYRYYNDRASAVKAVPFKISSIPLNAERARKMGEHELIIFPTQLNLLVNARIPLPLEFVNLAFGGFYLLNGQYDVEILRLPHEKIRVRMSLKKLQQVGANLSIGPSISSLIAIPSISNFVNEVTNFVNGRIVPALGTTIGNYLVSLEDKFLADEIPLNMIDISFVHQMGNIFTIDYVFDLSDPQASEAYDQLFHHKRSIKNSLIKYTHWKDQLLVNKLVSDATLAEKIASEDIDKANKRVLRVAYGQDKFQRNSGRLTTSIGLATATAGLACADHKFKYTASDGEKKQMRLSASSWSVNGSALFGLSKLQVLQNNFALFSLDENQSINGLSAVGSSYFRNESHLRPSEWSKLKKHFQRNIPAIIYKQMDLANRLENQEEWNKNKIKKDILVFMQVLFTQKANYLLSTLSYSDWKRNVDSYLQNNPKRSLVHLLALQFQSQPGVLSQRRGLLMKLHLALKPLISHDLEK
ncbi:MAG: hypothetical protein HQK51_08370 [Oligoflexia bacterium]|nr:hypothetical protein [Oligoflexia bacterium]